MKKIFIILKKICATLTALCFVLTIVNNNLYAFVNAEPIQDQKQYFDSSDNYTVDALFSSKYGKIVSYNNNLSDTVLINIQDLHCDYFVQKNIFALIDEVSKKYKIDNVYVEGGIGNIDTSFFANINSQYKQEILEKLLKEGKLTGTEYYSALNDKVNLLKGVEDKEIYLKNIVRLDDIINSKKEISVYLSKIDKEIDFLKSKYLKGKNKQFDELLKQSESKKYSQEKFISELFAYAEKNNISLKNYENLKIYLSLFDYSINNKKVQNEFFKMLSDIKQTLTYDEYIKFLNLTSNFSDIQKLDSFVRNFCNKNNINLSKVYPNLEQFFVLKEKSAKYNPIELVKEERILIDIIRTYLSESQTELEVAYLSDFKNFYKDYLSAGLTAAQWEYVKLGLDKFKELYAKYSIENDVSKLERYSQELNSFYNTNSDRNEIFVKNMNLNKEISNNTDINSNIADILSSAKRIVILVAGGYHTDGINEILNKEGITNITITPNITNSTQNSRLQYEYLAQQQAMSIKQMIALGLISNATAKEQILTIVSSLLSNQNLDGVNINILVQQLNQLFSQDITVSFLEEGSQLEFSFKDGTKQIIDIDEELAKIVEEQNKTTLSDDTFVRVTGTDLGKIVELVSKTAFTGTEIFAPQIYKISKDVCLFMVEKKWYLGNGAVWEIANSEYNGQALDGVEPVIYEYMPDFMQRVLLEKEKISNEKKGIKINLKYLTKKFISAFLVIAMTVSLTACSITNRSSQVENYRFSPQISYTLSNETDFEEYILNELNKFSVGEGKYKSFLIDTMDSENKATLTKQEENTISNQENLYDQALVALMFIQQAQVAKENGDIVKMNSLLSEAEKVLSAIDSQSVLYKSNLEHVIVTGEILWVGIAATQYKLVSGGDKQFDGLIEKVDKHINMFYRNTGFIYGRADENWVSTEHILDAIAYYNLKLYCDGKYGVSVDFNIQNRLKTLSSYLYKELYDKDKSTFYRGRNDNYYVLDTCSWGVQVLSMVEYMNPELFEYELNDTTFLKDIDIYFLLDYAEAHFRKTVEYNGKKYENLYTAAEEYDDPIMFEWTIQMAISYSIAANKREIEGDIIKANEYRQKAENIIKDVKEYSKALGFDNIPYVDKNGELIYSKNGWIGYEVEFVAGLAQMQQYYLGSFYFPLDDTEKKIEILPSSILPSTLKEINKLISNGIFSIKKALFDIIKNETLKSFFTPLNFIRIHSQNTGAIILTTLTAIAFLLSLGILLSQSLPLILSVVSSLITALFANIGTHIIMDYRYLKSIGLDEAISLYGKENVKLTEQGLSIDNKNSFKQIYVINDKPKNSKIFNFKSVPIKIRTQSGSLTKCWIGNYNGTTVLFAEDADYELIVDEFNKTRQFETVYENKTSLKANVDVIEIDMNNPDSNLRYSQKGNPIIGANILKTADRIDLEKEVSLLKNKKIEAVTINQNVAIYIDDEVGTLSTSQDFVNVIDLYINNKNLGTDVKVLFSNKYIDRVLELLEQEQGSKDLAQQKFVEIIKQLKDDNKDVIVFFDDNLEDTNLSEYQKYGIFSYIIGNEYIDGITATKSQAKFVTNLSQISCFDGSLSIIKVSLFRKEIEQSSGIFTFLSSSLNLKEYMKNRSIKFIKQVASNFDYNQIPKIDIDVVAKILQSENKFEELRLYLNETDSISIYYLGLSTEEEKIAFIDTILERILVANYLREFDKSEAFLGLKNKKMETILAAALIAKYNKDGNFKISSQISLNENLTTAQFELEFEKMIFDKVSTGFKEGLSEISDPQSIDDIIKLIPLYAERNAQLRTANVEVMDIQNIKGILSAA